LGITIGFMNENQVINQEIRRHLLESQLSVNTFNTIMKWLHVRNQSEKEQYLWARLILTIANTICDPAQESLEGAVAMELYAMAADILDDIEDQDNDTLPWRKVSAAEAINLASCILVLSFKALSAIHDPYHYRQANETFQQMGINACEGQSLEFQNEKQREISLDQYFETVNKKSGALTAGACKLGAILANNNESLIRDFGELGQRLGIISQIKNDLHDFSRFDTKSDFAKGKKTLPLVYLFHVLKDSKAEELRYLCSLAQQDWQRFGSEERKRLSELTIQEGAAHYCAVTIGMFKQQAVEIIDGMKIKGAQKKKLIGLVGK